MKCYFMSCDDPAAVMVQFKAVDYEERGKGWSMRPFCLYHYNRMKHEFQVFTTVSISEHLLRIPAQE